jgi:hypothetical protein
MKPAIMARAATKSSARRAWARAKRAGRSTGPGLRAEGLPAGVGFMSSSAMITLQAVREIPQISGMIADAAEGFE